MTPRFTPSRLALSYIVLGVLALLAILVWYGFRANVGAVAIVLALGLVFAWLLRRAHGQLEALAAQRAAQLSESEKRYERVMQASEDGFWEWVAATDEFYASPRMLAFYGLPPDTVFRGRKDFLSRFPFHPDDLELWRKAVAAHLAGETARVEIEVRVKLPSEIRWIHLTAICLRDASGAEERWTGSVSDVTERRRAQEALRASEERYGRVVLSANAGIWDWDVATDEYYVSPRLLEMSGFAPGTTFSSREQFMRAAGFHPQDLENWQAAVRRLFAGSDARLAMEVRMIVNGHTRWCQLDGICFRGAGGRVVRWTGSVTDITGRKRAEEALRASDERYAWAMDAAEEGHFDFNIETGELFISERLNQVYGFPPGTRFANRAEYLARLRLHPDDIEKYHATLSAAEAKDGPERYEFEFRIVRPSGEVRWLRTHGKVARDAEGRARRRTGVVADITERKLAEEALRLSEERYALAMEAAGDGHTDWNLVTGEFYISPRLLSILGYAPGTTFADRADWVRRFPFHPEDRERWEAAVAAHFAGREAKFRIDLRIVVNGDTRWVAFTFIATRDASGKPVRWTGSIADIDESKRAAEALHQSEDRHSRAMTAADAGFWDWHLAKDEFYVSPRLLEMTGFAPGTTFAGRADFMRRAPFHPDDREAYQQAVKALFAGEGSRIAMELRVIVEGKTTWQRLVGMCFRDAEGKVVRWTGSATYVTARKLAEEALRLSEKRYALAMEVADEGHFDWDVQTDEIFSSAQALRVIGVPEDTKYRTRADIMARVCYHPEDWPRISAQWRAVLDGRATEHEFEYRILRGEQPRWIRGRWKVFRDETGAALRVVGVIADITERKLAADQLRESEARFRALAESALAGIYLIQENRFRYVNPAMATMFGYTPEELVDRLGPADLVHPDDRALVSQNIRRRVEREVDELRYEFRGVRRDGSVFPVEVHGRRIELGGKPGVMGALVDNTERKRAVDELRESEARFRALTELSSDAYWAQDENLRFIPTGSKNDLAGYPSDAHIGKRRWELSNATPLSSTWEEHEAVLQARKPFRDFEYRRAGPDGSGRYLSISGTPIFDEQGTFRGYQGVGKDITDRKRAEEEVRASEARFRALTELSSDWYWEQDENLRFTYLSHQAGQLTGYSGESSLGKTRWEIANMEPLSCSWQEHQQVLAARQPFRDLECRRIGPDGTVRYLSMSGAPVFDEGGRFKGYQGIGRNITERKRAEEKLRESEALKSAMFETALDCIISMDHHGRVIEFNPAAERTFGYRRAEAMGKELASLIIPPRLREQHRRGLARYLATGEGPVLGTRVEISAMRADGAELPVELSVTRIPGEGAPLFTAYLRDITERKRAEEKLRESEARFRSLTEISSDWYWRQDENLRFTYLSAGVSERAGWPAEDYIGRLRWEVADIHPISCSWAEHQEVLAKRQPFRDLEYWRPGKDGLVSYTSISGAPIFDEQGRFRGYQGVGRNITERKRAEEKLRESEARFRALTELSSDWYWQQDQNLRFVNYEPAEVGTRSGIAAASSLGKTRWEFDHVTPLSSSWEEHKAVLAARQPFRDFEYVRLDESGIPHYTVISGVPTFDAQGRFTGYRGVGRNVSERRRFEAELRSRQEMLDLAQESARAVAFEWRLAAEGPERSRWSPGLAAMHGIAVADYDGSLKQYKKLIHPGDWPRVKEAIQYAQRTGEVAAEYRVLYRDGSVHWLQAKGRMLFDAAGKPARMVGFMHDVTERKRVDEALRQSEERYALAVAGSNEGIFDWDLVSDRVYVSHRAQELFGLPRGELWRPRRDWRHILVFHADDAPRLHQAIKAHIEGSSPTYDVEFRIVLPAGAVRWFRQRGIALRDASGKAYRVVGSIGDVTEKHSVEEELRAVERKLRLAQRLEAMGTLAGGIAHDFNNILGAILGYGEMALRDAAKGSRLRRDLDSIVTAGERGRALVDRVLAFSRSGVGERVPVHVEKVVREALDLVSAKLPPDVTLHAKLHTGRAAMLGDATQVHQVVMNLATNAIQAMPHGGTLRVSLRTLRLEAARAPAIGILDPGEYLVLEVSDTGTGIAPEILDRIFDPFFTTKEVGTGTGLGLSLVHGIVAEVGGAIDVASNVGAGSTFTVYLPRAGDAGDSEEEAEHALPRGGGQRVLVVDDEEPLVRLATRTLQELGYAPVGFTSSTKALAAFRADPLRFDALITDERMPGMSGSALIREVRGIRDGIPIMLMSGYVGGAIASRARDAGAAEVLKKPLSARELATSLARVLQP